MSLPPAVKDISDHPAQNAVTDPVDKDKLAADLDRKASDAQLDSPICSGDDNARLAQVSLRYIEVHPPVDSEALSPTGKKLIKDLQEMIETVRTLVREKNDDELIQYFLWHTRDVQVRPGSAIAPTQATSFTADKIKDDGAQVAHHLRSLISLLISNSEARKLFSDFSLIGRDLLVRSANLIQPDESALRQVDDPVANGQPAFKQRDNQVSLASAEEEVLRERMQNARRGTEETLNAMSSEGAKQGFDTETGQGNSLRVDNLRSGVSMTDSQLKGKIPEKHREQVASQYDRARGFLLEDYFPQERREKFIYRLKKVIIECQNERDYQESVRWLLDIISQYTNEGTTFTDETRPRVDWEQGSLKTAKNELFALLTRVANNRSPQPIVDAGRKLYDISRNDQELREWFQQINSWLRKILLESGYVVNEECDQEGRRLRENGRKFFDQKYKTYFDNLFNGVGDWLKNVIDDPLNGRLMNDWTRLIRDLLLNSEGTLSWKPELWADIRSVILPQIVDKAGYIPIPRAEFSNQALDLVIENLALSGQNFFPNVVSIEAHNYAKFSPHAGIPDRTQHNLIITLSQIQVDIRDVMFYFNKKTGFPKIKDSGIADVLIGGNGITTTIHLMTAQNDSGSLFDVQNVNVKIDHLKFSIRDSKHDALYKFLRPLATGIVKRQVKNAIRDGIISALLLVNQQLVRIRDKMSEARAKEENATRIQALRDVMNFIFKKRFILASLSVPQILKQQTGKGVGISPSPREREKHFNIMPKRDSLLLPNEGNPNGWICRQDFEERIASEGQEWRSPA
ncbi:hypothetical protein Clacol_007329 [Clathrus columnatus]|uniref:Uncharacterized protein n=1 Tax=Clathrus columnatus TaxID=1419009 RepID=A0AAV5AEL5_9AGAM|nr:hypothetical protein Clacol_007329 [Clathrus columnatus]